MCDVKMSCLGILLVMGVDICRHESPNEKEGSPEQTSLARSLPRESQFYKTGRVPKTT